MTGKKRNVYDIYNTPHLRNVCVEIGRKIKEGKRFVLKFEEVTKRKSQKQLGNLFGNLLTPFTDYLTKEYGLEINTLALERKLVEMYSIESEEPSTEYSFDFVEMQPVVVPTRLSDMNTAQAAAFTNWCVEFIRERFPDLNLPPYIDYLWMNNITEAKINQVVYASQKFPQEDKAYLYYIRQQPCIVCCAAKEACQAHHLRDVTLGTGVATKAADYFALPLCNSCHQVLHDKGTKELEVLIEPILNDHPIGLFCKLCYYRWVNHL